MRKDNHSGKRKTLIIVMAAIICLSMVFSIFAIYLDNAANNNSLSYNKYDFKIINQGYATTINKKVMNFYHFPSELERINLSNDIVNELKSAQIVIVLFNPNETQDDLIFIDQARFDLSTQMDKPVVSAITRADSKYPGLIVLGCENATVQTPILLINVSSASSFETNPASPYCITVNGRLNELLAVKDRLVYGYYGVMSNMSNN